MKANDRDEVRGWFVGRLPEEWFAGPLEVDMDRDEILVVGTLATPELEADAGEPVRRAAERSRIEAFREDTRARRIKVAEAAEIRFRRKVSWGARCGETTMLFTHLSLPAMTRLRLTERRVLDTLVDGGVARSRSEALAWCVRLVGRNQDEWLAELREALVKVEAVRNEGPTA